MHYVGTGQGFRITWKTSLSKGALSHWRSWNLLDSSWCTTQDTRKIPHFWEANTSHSAEINRHFWTYQAEIDPNHCFVKNLCSIYAVHLFPDPLTNCQIRALSKSYTCIMNFHEMMNFHSNKVDFQNLLLCSSSYLNFIQILFDSNLHQYLENNAFFALQKAHR